MISDLGSSRVEMRSNESGMDPHTTVYSQCNSYNNCLVSSRSILFDQTVPSNITIVLLDVLRFPHLQSTEVNLLPDIMIVVKIIITNCTHNDIDVGSEVLRT